MAHWLTSYIGKPYQLGSSGPDAFDCWSFVQWVLAHHYGHNRTALDDLDALIALAPSHWETLDRPHDGAVAFMGMGGCSHVGVWIDIDKGGVAHCMEGYGVIFTPLSTLPAIGCHVIAFHGFSNSPQ